jgi:hypothetical protein
LNVQQQNYSTHCYYNIFHNKISHAKIPTEVCSVTLLLQQHILWVQCPLDLQISMSFVKDSFQLFWLHSAEMGSPLLQLQ